MYIEKGQSENWLKAKIEEGKILRSILIQKIEDNKGQAAVQTVAFSEDVERAEELLEKIKKLRIPDGQTVERYRREEQAFEASRKGLEVSAKAATSKLKVAVKEVDYLRNINSVMAQQITHHLQLISQQRDVLRRAEEREERLEWRRDDERLKYSSDLEAFKDRLHQEGEKRRLQRLEDERAIVKSRDLSSKSQSVVTEKEEDTSKYQRIIFDNSTQTNDDIQPVPVSVKPVPVKKPLVTRPQDEGPKTLVS